MKKRFLSTLLAVMMVLSLLPGTAMAASVVASGACGFVGNKENVTWSLDSDGVLSIIGVGKAEGYGAYTGAPWYEYRTSIKSVYISPGVTNIGAYAFNDCSNMTSVSIPSGILEIGIHAFDNCASLKSVVLPDSLDEISRWAFIDCRSLTSVKLPSKLKIIDSSAFYNCTSLKSIAIPETVHTINGSVFQGSGLTSITIPASVTSFGGSMFKDCFDLESAELLCKVQELPINTFANCSTLVKVTLPSTINKVRAYAFSGCINLPSVSLPAGVTLIDSGVFKDCTSLKDVYFAGTQEQWNAIKINSQYNQILSSANIHYNGDDPAKPHTVTFDPNGGTVSVKTMSVTNGTLYGELPTPTRTGYKFNGWYTGINSGSKVLSTTKVNLVQDQTLYAHWTKTAVSSTCKITLNANGGKVSPASISVAKNTAYYSQLPTPTRSGYTFSGWYTSKTGGTKITSATKATANRTIYARWTRNKTWLVEFDPNGGTVYQDMKAVFSGVNYKDLPTPTRPNYHFKGWYTAKSGGTKVTASTRVKLSANQTLYAQWQTSATVRTTENSKWTVTIPEYYELALYSTASANKITGYAEEKGVYQDIVCTQKATLSNGTVRYRGTVNGKSVWFTYSCEMDVR